MKIRFWFILLFLNLNVLAIAQNTRVELLSPCEYIYRNGPNQIKISVNGKIVNPNNYKIKLEGGTYSLTDSSIWVNIYSKSMLTLMKKNGSVIGQKIFKVMPNPTFHFTFDGLDYNGLNKLNLMRLSNIIPISYNWPINIRVSVLSYKVKLTIGNETHYYTCFSSEISDSLRSAFSSIKALSNIEFSNLTLEDEKGYQISEMQEICSAEINSYHKYLQDYSSLFFRFKKFEEQIIDPYDTFQNHFLLYLNNTDRIIESNCTFSSDTCVTSLFYIINGEKQLVLRYHYLGYDSERVELFYNNLQIAEMNYYKNYFSGYYEICYLNGEKKEEGSYKIDGYKTDTILYINPSTLMYEKKIYKHEKSVKSGWTRIYNNGKLIDEKQSE